MRIKPLGDRVVLKRVEAEEKTASGSRRSAGENRGAPAGEEAR